MHEVCEFLNAAGVFYIATCEGDQPRVRPFGVAHIFEDKLYIHSGRGKKVSDQMLANPKVELCAFHKGTTLRVAATVVDDTRLEAQQSVLDANPGLKGMYAAGDGKNQVLYLKDATATFSAHGKEPRIVTF